MSEKVHVAVYERDPDADAWNVRIKGLTGCQTYGRSLRQAQTRIREALALWFDVEPDAVTFRDQFPADLAAVASGVARARHSAELAGAKAHRVTAEAVRQLTDRGLSRRDAAELLGLSHQRVHQLLEAG